MLRRIGLFGGTFDPIHNGHLRMALELRQQLSLDEMRLLPCHLPPHRAAPDCSCEDRLAMVRLAVADCPQLQVDARELQRSTPSYSVETLEELRLDLGAEVSLCWCVGMDSLAMFNTWHRWRELLDFAHLVVVGRPGWHPPERGELGRWLEQHLAADPALLAERAGGSVVLVENPMLEISATHIRASIAVGNSAQFLVPDAVWRYMRDNDLYVPTKEMNF